MAREITGSIQLNVAKGYQPYQLNTSFAIDMSAQGGPTPGGIIATVAGKTVPVKELTLGGVLVIINYDPTNFVSWGPYSGATFYPCGEIGPGETQFFKLSRTIAAFRIKADTADCRIFVGIFEK